LGRPRRVDQEKTRTLIRLHTSGDISYEEFRGERSLNEAAQRELRDRVSHARAGFEEARDITTGLAILSSLEIIWDRCETEERRRQFAVLLFTRDRRSVLTARDWALNNPLFRRFLNTRSPVRKVFWLATPTGQVSNSTLI